VPTVVAAWLEVVKMEHKFEDESGPKTEHKVHGHNEGPAHHGGQETHHHKKKESNSMMYIIIGVMSLLLLFSAVQAYQINEVQKELGGPLVVSTSGSSSSTAGSGSSAPAPRPAAVPAMVGGC
jgi:cytoskeletal protein RodZ